jgi:hypothetical protein
LLANRLTDQGSIATQNLSSPQIIKVTTAITLRRIRKHLGKTHALYVQRLDELLATAKEEKEQERERGGAK